MRIKNIDLLLVVAISLANIMWALLHGHMLVIGLLIAFPQVFLLPGYTLLEVLYYRHALEAIRRLALCLGLSISMDILSGFLLNTLTGGLNAFSWGIYLGTLTTLLSLVAAVLRGKVSANGMWLWQIRPDVRKHIIASLLIAVALGLILLSFLYSRHSALTPKRLGFTDFWMIQDSKDKSGCSVLIGIQSFEFTKINYHILVTVNKAQAYPWLPAQLLPQKVWVTTLPVTSYANGEATIDAQLYRIDQPKRIYRDAHLLLYSRSNGQGLQCSILHTGVAQIFPPEEKFWAVSMLDL